MQETFTLVSRVHSHPCVLLDGDPQGRTYFDALKVMTAPPARVVFWPDGWEIEYVMGWIGAADSAYALATFGEALGEEFAADDELIAYFLRNKSYAPTQETVATILMANEACRARAASVLGGLSDVLAKTGIVEAGPFRQSADDSTEAMQVYKLHP